MLSDVLKFGTVFKLVGGFNNPHPPYVFLFGKTAYALRVKQTKHKIACRDWNNLGKCREREQQNIAVIEGLSYRG